MTALVCLIPARLGSSRLPKKPLLPILGLPLLLHVVERCRLYREFAEVAVATCDVEIKDLARKHGVTAVMTSDRHERATDRVAEAVARAFPAIGKADPVVMVQGDEVLAAPDLIEAVVGAHRAHQADVVNLGTRLYRPEDIDDPNTVKITAGVHGQALYLSRSAIPSRLRIPGIAVYQQTGIMAFTPRFLETFSELPQTPLEKAESVDMLRVLEHGRPLRVVLSDRETLGVDTPADLVRAEEMLRRDPHTSRYLDRRL